MTKERDVILSELSNLNYDGESAEDVKLNGINIKIFSLSKIIENIIINFCLFLRVVAKSSKVTYE